MDPLKVDKRTVRRNLEKNLITEKEYEGYIADLADLEGEYEEIDISLKEEEEEEPVEVVPEVVPVPVFTTTVN